MLGLLLKNINELLNLFAIFQILTNLGDGHNCSMDHLPIILREHLLDIGGKDWNHHIVSKEGEQLIDRVHLYFDDFLIIIF